MSFIINTFSESSIALPTLAYQGFTIHPVETQTVTWTGVAIGTASSDRRVFISVPWYNLGSSAGTITGATIGGIAATIHVQTNSNFSTRNGSAIVSALVPTGTTATVTVTFSISTVFRPRIAVYAVTGLLSSTPVDSLTFNSTLVASPKTFTINCTADGVAIITMARYSSTTTATLSGITADYTVSPVAQVQLTGGAKITSSTGTQDCTVTGGQANYATCMVSFR